MPTIRGMSRQAKEEKYPHFVTSHVSYQLDILKMQYFHQLFNLHSIHVPNPYHLRTLTNNSQVQYMLLITMIKNGHENEMSFLCSLSNYVGSKCVTIINLFPNFPTQIWICLSGLNFFNGLWKRLFERFRHK